MIQIEDVSTRILHDSINRGVCSASKQMNNSSSARDKSLITELYRAAHRGGKWRRAYYYYCGDNSALPKYFPIQINDKQKSTIYIILMERNCTDCNKYKNHGLFLPLKKLGKQILNCSGFLSNSLYHACSYAYFEAAYCTPPTIPSFREDINSRAKCIQRSLKCIVGSRFVCKLIYIFYSSNRLTLSINLFICSTPEQRLSVFKFSFYSFHRQGHRKNNAFLPGASSRLSSFEKGHMRTMFQLLEICGCQNL